MHPATEPVTDRIDVRATLVVTRLLDGGDLAQHEAPLILDHPAVSRRHASLVRRGEDIVVRDEGSTNGTFVNRRRLDAEHVLRPDEVVEVGPFRLLYDGCGLIQLSRATHAALNLVNVARDVVSSRTQEKTRILQSVSLSARPGRVMCIIGASGSGKSTLLNVMSGRIVPSEGEVRFGSLNLHRHFAALKQDIAYLPQSEIVHELLTLRQALDFAAQLRLPRETAEAARAAAVMEAATAVGLQSRLDVPIGQLSGGQRKRACLASEILARPSVLFVDEATSGLDEVTDREVMALLKRLAREGMTIVCVTHTLANLHDYCDDLVVLAPGGKLAYAGAPSGALAHFRAASLGDALAEIDERGAQPFTPPPALLPPAAAVGHAPAQHAGRTPSGTSAGELGHQLSVLIRRNTRLLLADRRALGLAMLQSVVIGALLGYSFMDFGDELQAPQSTRVSVLLLCVTTLWMGCNSASKDIVGEWPIFKREHDVNLSTLSFVASKFIVTGAFAMSQVVLLLLVALPLIERIPGGVFTQLPYLLLCGLSGVAWGLAISSFCHTRDQASIIVPLAVAPQLILGGGLAPLLPAPAEAVAKLGISAYHLRLQMESAGGLQVAQDALSFGTAAVLLQMLVLLTAAWWMTQSRARV